MPRALLFLALTAAAAFCADPDSLRAQVGRLAAQGRLDEAQALVARDGGSLPPTWAGMFRGKLDLDGDSAARGFATAAADSSLPGMQGEAAFRLGQYQYVAARYHLAIPQFREYLSQHPAGPWAEASAYWMAFSCLQFSRQHAGKEAYLDTALTYLRRMEAKNRSGYYWPLARAAEARILLQKGDTAGAQTALRDARRKSPPEELPGVFLLSMQADNRPGGEWEDSLRWDYPLSPETQSLAAVNVRSTPAPASVPAAAPAPSTPVASAAAPYALQLGVFSLHENAERLQKQLAEKNLVVRIDKLPGDRGLFRVSYGGYKDSEAAARDGKRLFKPLGYEYRVIRP